MGFAVSRSFTASDADGPKTRSEGRRQQRSRRMPTRRCRATTPGGDDDTKAAPTTPEPEQQQQQQPECNSASSLLLSDGEHERLYLFQDEWQYGTGSEKEDDEDDEDRDDEDDGGRMRTRSGCAADDAPGVRHAKGKGKGKAIALTDRVPLDNVDEVLRKAHAGGKGRCGKHTLMRYTLVKRNPDGRSARVATEDDIKDLTRLLSAAQVAREEPAPSKPAAARNLFSCQHKQYKVGGPCNHCGVTESPQWRRGPEDKPCLCNACGTRYRRTNSLASCGQSAGRSSVGKKRELQERYLSNKKPLLLSAVA